MIYRLRVAEASASHMDSYRDAMAAAQAISDNRGYNFIAGFHGAPGWYCWHHQRNPRTPLQARIFLPWHRAYLQWLELALRDRVPAAAIPWWDWTVDQHIPAAFNARRLDGKPNPLSGSRAVVPNATPPIRRNTPRAPGANRGATLPTAGGSECRPEPVRLGNVFGSGRRSPRPGARLGRWRHGRCHDCRL